MRLHDRTRLADGGTLKGDARLLSAALIFGVNIREGNDGPRRASWTPDLDKALTFTTGSEAAACYRAVPRSRPVRPDGKPNRPLTVFTLVFE